MSGCITELRVLVIDDSKTFLEFISTALRALSVKDVTCVESAAIAHETARNSSALFDCVICDEFMPGASGLEFLKVIRLGGIAKLRANIPFILCTSSDDPRLPVAAEHLQVTAFLKKPPTMELLRDALERASRCEIRVDLQTIETVCLPELARN